MEKRKQIDVNSLVKIIIGANEKINDFTKSGSMIDVLPWLQYIIPQKVDKFNKLIVLSDVIMMEQVREHFESFSGDEIRDVADAIRLSDADDEKTMSRLHVTLSDLQAAAFVIFYLSHISLFEIKRHLLSPFKLDNQSIKDYFYARAVKNN